MYNKTVCVCTCACHDVVQLDVHLSKNLHAWVVFSLCTCVCVCVLLVQRQSRAGGVDRGSAEVGLAGLSSTIVLNVASRTLVFANPLLGPDAPLLQVSTYSAQ